MKGYITAPRPGIPGAIQSRSAGDAGSADAIAVLEYTIPVPPGIPRSLCRRLVIVQEGGHDR
jgi:hypothetical protein